MQSAGQRATPSGPWAGLAALGCVLAALARTGGGDPFQDFALGLLMGLGVGCMAVGAVFLALSLRYQP